MITDKMILFDVTLKEGGKVYTMRKEVNDPMKLVVLIFFNNLCHGELSEEERDEFYMNFVVPCGLQDYVGELVDEMEQIIINN